MMGKIWTKTDDELLIEKYADTYNIELAKMFNCGIRTVQRHANKLGLQKSERLIKEIQRKASMAGTMQIEYMSFIGKKKRGTASSGSFKKGRIPDPETEKKRIAVLRQLAWKERKRVIHGFKQKTKWKFNADYKLNNDDSNG